MSTPEESISGGPPWFKCTPAMTLGEAPIYRASDSTLHWVDCLRSPAQLHILKIDPETGDAIGSARILELEDSVSVMYFRKDHPGSYICAYSRGVAFMDEQSGKLEVLKEIIPSDSRDLKRFNDAGVDAKGRFWLAEIDKLAMAFGAGKLPESYGKPKGRLWRYSGDGSLDLMDEGLICGNGVEWSPDNKTLYVNDSVGMLVYAYDFDLESGAVSNKRILVDRRESSGEPDGMVVDTDGNLWISVYGTNRMMAFDPSGKHLKDIIFPAHALTCPAWGGKNFDTLFLTSGQGPEEDTDDQGGHIFRYKPATARGRAKFEFAG